MQLHAGYVEEEGITYFRVSHLLPFFAEGWMLQFVCYYFDHHQVGKKLDRLLVIDAERVFVMKREIFWEIVVP